MSEIKEKLKACKTTVLKQNLIIKKISLKLKKSKRAFDKKCLLLGKKSPSKKSPSKKSPSKKSPSKKSPSKKSPSKKSPSKK